MGTFPERPTPPPPDKGNMSEPKRPPRTVPEPRRVSLPSAKPQPRTLKPEPSEEQSSEKNKKFLTRTKLIILSGAFLLISYLLWGYLSTQQTPDEQTVLPNQTPTASASAVPSSTPSSSSSYGEMSSSDRAEFYAQYTAEAFVTAYFNRSAKDGSAGALAQLKPTLTPAAYKKAQDEVSRWPWDKCAATNCEVRSQVLNMYRPDDAAEGETVYVVQISMTEGPESNKTLLPQLLYRVHLYPTSNDGTKWLVDDYTRIPEVSSD